MVAHENSLPLVLISNNLELIQEADSCKIARIMLDLETIGKKARQQGKNLYISNHCIDDIIAAKKILSHAKCMVRINPLQEKSKQEIENVVANGADIIMLPFFKNSVQVQTFLDHVGGRCRVNLLLETNEALANIHSIVSLPGIDEIHIGLNDLCLSLENATIFDVIIDGTLEKIRNIIVDKGIQFGFGGVAPPGVEKYPISPYLIIATDAFTFRTCHIFRKVSTS